MMAPKHYSEMTEQERRWSRIAGDPNIDGWQIPEGCCYLCPGCAREGFTDAELNSSEPDAPFPVYSWDELSEAVCDSCHGIIRGEDS